MTEEKTGAEKMFGDFAPALVRFTDDVLFGVALGVAIPVAAFRWFTPNEVFPVVYRRGRTAHLDVDGRRVTTPEGIEVVRELLAEVNARICAAIGPQAVGLMGDEIGLQAQQVEELGLVGVAALLLVGLLVSGLVALAIVAAAVVVAAVAVVVVRRSSGWQMAEGIRAAQITPARLRAALFMSSTRVRGSTTITASLRLSTSMSCATGMRSKRYVR